MDRERLQNETWRQYYAHTLRKGFVTIFTTWWRTLVFAVICEVIILLCPSSGTIMDDLILLAYILMCVVFVLVYVYANGHVPGTYRYYRNFQRAGFVNSAGEAPLLVERSNYGNTEILDFQLIGQPLTEWVNKSEEIQASINRYVFDVRHKRGNLAVQRLFTVPSSACLPDYIPWSDSYINTEDSADYILGHSLEGDVHVDIEKQPHWLIGGSTGSGKSRLTFNIAYMALCKGEAVSIYDGKGLDFEPLRMLDAKVLRTSAQLIRELEACTEDMDRRTDEFAEAGARSYVEYQNKVNNPMLHRKWIVIDECAGLLDPTGRSKAEKETIAHITELLATIAQKGRAVGYHLLISTQRPDANAVPGVIKSNLDLRICGKADATLSTIILGDGRADTNIPKYTQGRFIIADGAKDTIFQAFYMET